MKISIKPSKVKDKRFVAIFTDDAGREIKRTNFGLKNPKVGTYIDHSDKMLRKNYIARHQVREQKFYKNPMRASTLSRFILWGDSDDLETAIKNYKSKFNLK